MRPRQARSSNDQRALEAPLSPPHDHIGGEHDAIADEQVAV